MPRRLRLIAVHVEEPEPQSFLWVLTERNGARWREIGRPDAASSTYKKAMADGLLALQAMVDDLDAGPRARGAGSDAEPAQSAEQIAPEQAPAPSGPTEAGSAQRPGKNAYFGFGPAR